MEIKTIWDAAIIIGLIALIILIVPITIGGALLYVLGVCFGIGTLTPWTAFLLGLAVLVIFFIWLAVT